MIVAVIGSRKFEDNWKVYARLSRFAEEGTEAFQKSIVIISGGAAGVDTWAKKAAEQYKLAFKEIKPDFSKGYDVKQYHLRNDKIIDEADKVIAFWDGKSKGTKSVIEKCLAKKKDVEIIF